MGESKCKLFIGGLPYTIGDDELRNHFAQFGDLTDVIVVKDWVQRSRGFGFVTYRTGQEVDKAMDSRPHVFAGRAVTVRRAIPKSMSNNGKAHQSSSKAFVRGIKDNHTEDMLRSYFQSYGEISEVTIVKDKETGKLKGFAFIQFTDYDPVDRALLDSPHDVGDHQLDVTRSLLQELSCYMDYLSAKFKTNTK